jgi:hypothetical protein
MPPWCAHLQYDRKEDRVIVRDPGSRIIEAPVDEKTSARARDLIRALASDDVATRSTAAAELVELHGASTIIAEGIASAKDRDIKLQLTSVADTRSQRSFLAEASITSIVFVSRAPSTPAANERSVLHAVRAIRDAQALFYSEDCDSNGRDFCTAGLKTLASSLRGEQVGLLTEAVVAADVSKLTEESCRPWAGYLFAQVDASMTNGKISRRAREGAQDYAIAAIPSRYGATGTRTFLLMGRESAHAIWGADTHGELPTYVPNDPEASGWIRLK